MRNTLQPSMEMGNEDRAEAASVSTSLPSQTDEKLRRYVLSINISPEPSKVGAPRKNISIMSINQEGTVTGKPFDGNLSDDQKLVLSVGSDGSVTTKTQSDIKLLCGSMKGIILSGKCSPYDDHIDSGTCSDAEVISSLPSSESPQPPALPPKMSRSGRQKSYVLTESCCSDTSSASSSDSVTNGDHLKPLAGNHLESPTLIRSIGKATQGGNVGLLPTSLLIDIRNRSVAYDNDNETQSNHDLDTQDDENEMNYSNLELCSNRDSADEKELMNFYTEDNNFYKFHINEHLSFELGALMTHDESDESFAGLKDLRSGTSTIRSKNGTIRGIKNRVRSGISTFLQMQQTTVKVSFADGWVDVGMTSEMYVFKLSLILLDVGMHFPIKNWVNCGTLEKSL